MSPVSVPVTLQMTQWRVLWCHVSLNCIYRPIRSQFVPSHHNNRPQSKFPSCNLQVMFSSGNSVCSKTAWKHTAESVTLFSLKCKVVCSLQLRHHCHIPTPQRCVVASRKAWPSRLSLSPSVSESGISLRVAFREMLSSRCLDRCSGGVSTSVP